MNNTAKIIKSATTSKADLELINGYSRRTLTEGEVYTFSVVLCDNDIDRDGERFSKKALQKLAELFVGKTGIFDHNPSAENQAARIYKAQMICDSSKKNALGEDYCYLEAKAYMLRNEKTATLIDEIDGGIKKEVSVGCSMKSRTCSICGTQKGLCSHRAGDEYDGRVCYFELDDPTDAYEWSFVAVPAQKNAGVIKMLNDSNELIKKLEQNDDEKLTKQLFEMRQLAEKMAIFAREQRNVAEKAVYAELTLAFPDLSAKLMAKMVERLDPDELMELKAYFDKKPALTQLSKTSTFSDNGRFKI